MAVRSLSQEGNAILDSAVEITAEQLAQHRIAIVEPVTARFQTDDAGNTGIELTVRLQDPGRVSAARAAIAERFGGFAHCDAVLVS
jgi:hypothetical protein